MDDATYRSIGLWFSRVIGVGGTIVGILLLWLSIRSM
jgi:hypothetical protein